MAFNAVDAAKLLTGDVLTDDEVKFIISARDGKELNDDVRNSEEFKALEALGLVAQMGYSNPRGNSILMGVVLTDNGMLLLNEIDRRYRENGSGVGPADPAPAGADLAIIRSPTENERAQVATTKEGRDAALKHLREQKHSNQKHAKATAKAAAEDDTNKKA